MGGGLILAAILIPTLLWMDISNYYAWYAVFITAGYGLLGFADDYLKINKNTAVLAGK